jgi:hypothetical protein
MRLPERLPQLGGRWLTAYRVLWAAFFVLALIGATYGQKVLYERNLAFNTAIYRLGLRVSDTEGVRHVSPLARTTGGFARDSRLLAIDGRPLPRETSYAEVTQFMRLIGGHEGQAHRLLLSDPQGHESTVTLTVRQANLDAFDAASGITMRQRLLLSLAADVATAVLFLGASALLFARRAREPVVALLALGFLALLATQGLLLLDPNLFDAIARIDLITLLIGLGLTVFPSGRFEPRWTLLVALVLVVTTTVEPWLPGGPVLAASVLISGGVVAANIVRYRRLASTLERQQVKWATLGIAAGVALLTIVGVIGFVLPSVVDSVTVVLLSALANVLRVSGVACLVGGLLVSLLRYRLYDADAALSRSAAYGGLAVAMIAVFAGSEKLVELLAERYWGESVGLASGAIAAGIAAALLLPLHHRLDRWAEKRFQGPLLALRTRLPDRLGDWRETSSPKELAAEALHRVLAAVHAQGGAVVADGAKQSLLAAQGLSEPTDQLPIRIGLGPLPGGATGWLLLGPRPDGTLIGKDEREAAQEIADPLGRALAVSMLRKAREDQLAGTLRKLAARISKLEARPT